MSAENTAALAAAKAPATAERWRDVVGYEGLYQVSDQGRVRSVDRVVERAHGRLQFVRGRVLAPFPYSGKAQRRYLAVHLSLGGLRETRTVHHLVLEAWVGPRPPGTLGCYFDDDHENNHLGNLRWDTHQGNARDRVRNALQRALAVFATW